MKKSKATSHKESSLERTTKTRRLLLEAFQNAESPQSVPELQELLAKKKYFPHKTTLYREIEKLLATGFLTKVQLSETRVSYELAGDHHHHFVCQSCFRVTKLSFCQQVLETLSRSLERQGKRITHHNFEFFGVCEFCL
jgi:Fe2+ or Zn2+ uptake regulation protein